MSNLKVSIIVTVHNSEETLRECLDSACNQTLKDIEILCIDGGSTDDSPGILAEYQKKDSRLKVINDKNTSYGHKVNVGIKQARGEYISILESDDSMKPYMLEKLYEAVKEYHPDFVDSDYQGIYFVNKGKCVLPVKKYGNIDCYGFLIHKMDCVEMLRQATGAIWTGIYRTEFLRENDICMFESPGASYQDTSFRFLINILADTSYHMKDTLYCYRMDNINSSIHSQKKIFAISKEYHYLENELNKRKVDKEIWKIYFRWKYSSYFWNTFRLDEKIRCEFLKLYQDELENDIRRENITRENQDESEYINTYLLLDDRKEFDRKIKEYARKGNLNINILAKQVSDLQDKEVIIFSCGVKGRQAIDILKNAKIKINCICDNSFGTRGTEWSGYMILSVEEAIKIYGGSTFVVPYGKYYNEMVNQLHGLGIQKTNIYNFVI